MSLFVSTADLEAFTQKTLDADQAEAAIDIAQEIVRSELGARAVLDAEAVESKFRFHWPRPNIEFRIGPIVSIDRIASVDVGGVAFDLSDGELSHPWFLERLDGLHFSANTLITCTYTAGFTVESDGSDDMPAQIRKAILMLAGVLHSNPNPNLVRERIGDWEQELKGIAGNQGDPDSLTLPGQVKLLLRPWVRPRF